MKSYYEITTYTDEIDEKECELIQEYMNKCPVEIYGDIVRLNPKKELK